MLKTIALVVLASTSVTRYNLRGAYEIALDNEMPSCGAAARLLADHYAVVIDWTKHTATINLTPWALAFSDDAIVLTFAAEPDARTHMEMYLDTSGDIPRARLFLLGFTESREACVDAVALVGR
jgi:hypothetical protein